MSTNNNNSRLLPGMGYAKSLEEIDAEEQRAKSFARLRAKVAHDARLAEAHRLYTNALRERRELDAFNKAI